MFAFNYTKQNFCILHTQCECCCDRMQSACHKLHATHTLTQTRTLRLCQPRCISFQIFDLSAEWASATAACGMQRQAASGGMPQACVHLCATNSVDHSCLFFFLRNAILACQCNQFQLCTPPAKSSAFKCKSKSDCFSDDLSTFD